MELKEYQQTALRRVQEYLAALVRWREKNEKVVAVAGPEAALNAPEKAWDELKIHRLYRTRKNGLGESVPNFCLKIPTGGGKTLMAVETLDLIHTYYRFRKTGFVLWIVPSNQIYRQTLKGLRDRDHPYRQHLDMASAGRTMIREKTDRFIPEDVAENLVVMLLMLPSANRQNKETLRLFKDSGGFDSFFPLESDHEANARILKKYPNLDVFGEDKGFFGRMPKTSLGNTLRMLAPVVIMDEGHKAYSETAQNTLLGFNPSIIVELSATPKPESNVLVDIPGLDLAREEMIKLDLHVINKAGTDWKTALLAAKEKRDALEEKANELEKNAGPHIRPICLIQVERTGKEQRGGQWIHAEDAREYLVQTCGLPAEQVAVKSSEKDDIEGLELPAKDCQVRYIITKQALQEGWDCAFAYVLCILTNPSSKDSLTQLVGRILRQPYARKTKIKELDESYVVCFQKSGPKLLESVRAGFRREGLGDLEGRVVDGDYEDEAAGEPRVIGYRERFRKFAGTIYLPVFAVRDDGHWRELDYETDLLSEVDWRNADFRDVGEMTLSLLEEQDTEIAVGLSEDRKEVVRRHGIVQSGDNGRRLDYVFISRHLAEFIPNPWLAHDFVKCAMELLRAKNDAALIENNLVVIIEKLRQIAERERDRLAEKAFRSLAENKTLRFLLLAEEPAYCLPAEKRISQTRTLNRPDGTPLVKSLFDFTPEEEFNELEKAAAWCFDGQEKLLWWYRNLSRQDYAVQGWKRNRIYADFVASKIDSQNDTEYDKVFVVETKGLHLQGNRDTEYKRSLFDFCNRMAELKSWSELGSKFAAKKVVFKVISEEEWREEINRMFGRS